MRIKGIKNRSRAKLIIKKLKYKNLTTQEIRRLLKLSHNFFVMQVLYPLIKYNIIRKILGPFRGNKGRRDFIYKLGNYDINSLHKLGL